MAFETVRAYVQLASGLGEVTRERASAAAQELLALAGRTDLSRDKVAKQVSGLADDLMAAAAQNRKNLVALVRKEIESALARADVASLADLDAAKTSLARLSAQVEELTATLMSSASRLSGAATGAAASAMASASQAAQPRPAAPEVAVVPAVTVPVEVEETPSAPPSAGSARRAPAAKAAKKAPARRSASATKPTTAKAAASKTAAKSTAKKSTATNAAAGKSTAKKSAATKAAAKKSTAKKSAAKKSAAKSTASTSAASKNSEAAEQS